MSLTAIATSRIDVDSPLRENIFEDLATRDLEVKEQILTLDFAEVSRQEPGTPDGLYQDLIDFADFFVPEWAEKLTLGFDVKNDGGTSTYRATMGALISSTDTTTSATYSDTDVRIAFSDLSTVAGSFVTLTLQVDNDTSNRRSYARGAEGPVCRFHR